jgi:hypothetical protein
MRRKIEQLTQMVIDYLASTGTKPTGFVLMLHYRDEKLPGRKLFTYTPGADPLDIAALCRVVAAQLEGQSTTPKGRA